MAKTTEKKLAYIKQYDKERCVMLSVKLNRSTDADIIEHLESIENRSGYVKELIREDIERRRA